MLSLLRTIPRNRATSWAVTANNRFSYTTSRTLSSTARRPLNSDTAKPAKRVFHRARTFFPIAVATLGCAALWHYVLRDNSRDGAYLSPTAFVEVQLANRTQLSPDAAILSFIVPNTILPNPTDSNHANGSAFASVPTLPSLIYFLNDQCYVARAYTPLPVVPGAGRLDFLVRHYPDGVVSPYLWNLAIGDRIRVRGPIEAIDYEPNTVRELGLVAGGTGIAPVLSLIRHICLNTEDMTKLTLIYCSRSPQSIYLREQLDDLQRHYAGQLRIIYMVDDKSNTQDPNLVKGRLSEKLLKQWLPKPSDDHTTGVMVCGSDSFVSFVAGPKKNDNDPGPLGGLLKSLRYDPYDVHKF